MIFDVPCLKSQLAKTVTPIAIVLLLGYCDFAVGWALGHQEIWRYHSHGVAITLWVLVGFCQVMVFIYWALIFIIGPGKHPILPLFDLFDTGDPQLCPLPDMFNCDASGYPFYESLINSLVVPRSFFSKNVHYQVLKYDHYCVWIGMVIGELNYMFFLKFMQWFLTNFVIILVMTIRYTPANARHGFNWNLLIIYIGLAFWIIMLVAMFGVHLRYVSLELTTLDELTVKQMHRWAKHRRGREELGIRYVNVAHGNDRRVVQFTAADRIYTKGFKQNWINMVFNGNRNHGYTKPYSTARLLLAWVITFLPLVDIPVVFLSRRRRLDPEATDKLAYYHQYSPEYSEEFRAYCRRQIDQGIAYRPTYMKIESHSSQESLPSQN